MSQRIPWKTALLYGSAILLGIVLGPFLTGALQAAVTQPTAAQAAGSIPAAALAPASPDVTYVCTPRYIAAFQNRIHVLCTVAAPGGIAYFAAPTSDSKSAARIMSVMLSAKALVKNLRIYYNANGSGAAYGCQVNDCRPIDGIEVMD